MVYQNGPEVARCEGDGGERLTLSRLSSAWGYSTRFFERVAKRRHDTGPIVREIQRTATEGRIQLMYCGQSCVEAAVHGDKEIYVYGVDRMIDVP